MTRFWAPVFCFARRSVAEAVDRFQSCRLAGRVRGLGVKGAVRPSHPQTWRSRRATWTETDSTVNFAGKWRTSSSVVGAGAPSTAARSTRNSTGRNTSSFARRRTRCRFQNRSPSRLRRPARPSYRRNAEKRSRWTARLWQKKLQIHRRPGS